MNKAKRLGDVLLRGTGADRPNDIGRFVCIVLPAEGKTCGKGVFVARHRCFGINRIVSAIHAWGMVDMHSISQSEINAVQASILTPDPDPVIHDLFQKTMHWLMDTSKGNVGYNAINLLIYVLLMPVLIITSICVCYKASKK